jgi:oligopeptide/dipeptide ABC transporter ATP-binding protein
LSLLFISHNINVVCYMSDRIAVMYVGEIVELASTRVLLSRPLHPYTQTLLASVPRTDPSKRRPEGVVVGEQPSPVNPPPGCRFTPRCSHAFDKYRTVRPRTHYSSS